MQRDFHYYGTYCAAVLAGYSHEESMDLCYSAEFVDRCSKTFLASIEAPENAATTMLALEMANARTDIIGLQDITRIWSSFHFLPYDLYADPGKGGKRYKNKYRLICRPNGELLKRTVDQAKGHSLQAIGIAMHVLADTWAHAYFAGTPSFAINNVSDNLVEIVGEGSEAFERPIAFRHNPLVPDDVEEGQYTNSIFQPSENTVMNLGHGRAGHLPDYSFCRYRYLPAWGDYEEIVKDNPTEYYRAFCQMVYALEFMRGKHDEFKTHTYATSTVEPWKSTIESFLRKRQLSAVDDWRSLGESLSGQSIEEFDIHKYMDEYVGAAPEAKDETFLGRYILAALAQKSLITHCIYASGSLLAGFSIDYHESGIGGIKDYLLLLKHLGGASNDHASKAR